MATDRLTYSKFLVPSGLDNASDWARWRQHMDRAARTMSAHAEALGLRPEDVVLRAAIEDGATLLTLTRNEV